MYKDVQATDKEVRDENIDKITEDIKAYVTEKYGEDALEERKMILQKVFTI